MKYIRSFWNWYRESVIKPRNFYHYVFLLFIGGVPSMVVVFGAIFLAANLIAFIPPQVFEWFIQIVLLASGCVLMGFVPWLFINMQEDKRKAKEYERERENDRVNRFNPS